MKCVACDRALVCAECGKPFKPLDEARFRAIHEPETAITCPACDAVLVCRACGHEYSGDVNEHESGETVA